MSEKEKLFENLVEKSKKSKEELNSLISNKVAELSGLVSEEGAIYIIANELGVRLDSDKPKKEADMAKIKDITEPKTPVSLYCKVIKKYDKVTFSSKSGSEGSVQSLLVGDEEAINRVVFWNDKTELLEQVQEGDILKILNAYTRENTNSNRVEIHYGQYSDIEVNPSGIEIELQPYSPTVESVEKKISEIEEGDRNIKITATVTDFDIPRFYLACPDCFKKVFQDEESQKCAEHGEVEATKVPIVNIIIDDGAGTLNAVAFRDRAEQLTKLKSEEIIELTQDVEKYKNFSKSLIGASIEVIGNSSMNNMTGEPQLLVNQIVSLELKELDEIVEEEVKETSVSEDSLDDIDDLEIEEIEMDDDLL